jgi:hypothetical protein
MSQYPPLKFTTHPTTPSCLLARPMHNIGRHLPHHPPCTLIRLPFISHYRRRRCYPTFTLAPHPPYSNHTRISHLPFETHTHTHTHTHTQRAIAYREAARFGGGGPHDQPPPEYPVRRVILIRTLRTRTLQQPLKTPPRSLRSTNSPLVGTKPWI